MISYKKIKEYTIYLIVFIVFWFFKSKFDNWFNAEWERFSISFYMYTALYVISNFIFGIVIGLPIFYKEIRNKGKWKLHLEKLLLLGIPAMFIVTISYFYLPRYPLFFELQAHSWESGLSLYATIFLGYVIISSVYKKIDQG
ncbi:hypothetical protein ACSVDA_01435 [Cytobacillus sp. Hm23]